MKEDDRAPVVEVKSAKLTVANGTCDLCGAQAVGTLDWSTEEKTFFCANCASLEYEETVAKDAQDPPCSC
jgi:hypothetical protein